MKNLYKQSIYFFASFMCRYCTIKINFNILEFIPVLEIYLATFQCREISMRQAQGQKGAGGLRPLNRMIKQQNIKVADFVVFFKI